ncbi:MAG: putative amidohydrolase YtcJ [Spirosomataceae bacterium]|jgi:predicted amidohydrolase YtcJ
MKYLFSLFFLIITLSCTKQSADLIVTNAVVYTVNDDFTTAEAFAVRNGKFVAVGTMDEITSKYVSKNVIDAGGKAIFPGLYDPHSHFLGLGQMLSQADLVGTTSYEEIIERLKAFEKENPDNQWLVGRGWDQNDWEVKEFPTKELLDEAFPDKPVALTRIDGHALIANSKALQLAKITSGSKVDGGDVILKNGEPTGVLIDNAQGFIRRVIPRAEEAEKRAMIQAAEAECFKYGLTTVSDAGLNRDDIELIEKMHEEGSLKIRDYVMVSLGMANLEYYLKKGIIKTDRLNVRSVKLYADGALGSRGACLLEPYADASDQTGFLLLSAKELERSLTEIYSSDYQANTHCIGDSANRLILDIYGKLLKDKNERRWRIEHAQIVSKTDVPKFGKYSIIPSIQATHGTSDMYWADERLGDERVKTAYAFQDLLKQNGMVANGSDFPVEFVNPIFGFHSAVARQDNHNFPEGGYQMENALTREQAMRAMTIWAAYANFEEKERGSIEVGKMADFILTDKDLMQIPNEEMRGVKVLKTVVGGEQVYSITSQ